MLLNNISLDVQIINECLSELEDPIIDKQAYFNDRVKDRLNKCNKIYLDNVDTELSKLEHTLTDNYSDIKTLSKALNSLSKLSSNLYRTELNLLDIL